MLGGGWGLGAKNILHYNVYHLKESLLGLLKNATVVKFLHVETIVPLKDLKAFKQKCFQKFYYYRQYF